jgi:mannose/cellobiose epimerase-like protein (N-acyl-D-glucosamine 2-epimerase family)
MERTYDPAHGCTLEWFTCDWRELAERTRGLINYGHIAEAAWFTSAVAAFTGDRAIADFGRSLLGFVLRRGWDALHGGLHSYGRPEGPVVDSDKVWWMQAELLGALSLAYRLTGDVLYRDWLAQQARFVFDKQRDAAVGEWHATVYADGTVRDGRKGSPSKAAYHVAQGLYHADANLVAATETTTSDRERDWSSFAL